MKFNYRFNIGDTVIYNNRHYVIERRIGKYDTPYYKLVNELFLVSETELTKVTPKNGEISETEIKKSNKQISKDMLRQNLENYKNIVPELSKYSRNLNLLAIQEKLNPTYCRNDEIKEIETTLLRRTKPNSILIGQSGCGKTAIVEELARIFVNKKLNDENYEMPVIFDLSLGSLISGAKYRGDFEERLQKIINEVIEHKNIIIFIDEIHCLTEIGAAEGSVSAGQLLKPALARGDIRCIGATTIEEYEKYILTDKALARRFSKVNVKPLAGKLRIECTENILKEYGKYFNINTEQISANHIINILDNFMANTIFPNNVIDIIDETLAAAKYDNKNIITISDINKTVSKLTGILII